ncbi:MAG: TonB-dependent receptor [Parabacteroides sp.]|nr:TonB-dependent receptor [Parabacteroides sp.]
MKLIVLLLAVSLSSSIASTSAQTANISISVKNERLENVLKEIENQSEFLFFYHQDDINKNEKVSINKKNGTLREILDLLSKNAGVNYAIKERHIVLTAKKESIVAAVAPQQSRDISGVITDTNGEPIIGANVMVKGTTNGTITDMDGRFTLSNVPGNAVLVISYIGYTEQVVNVSGQTVINAILKEDTQKLDEVVVVGYGVQKKANLTGSVSTVKYAQELENRPITDPSQALSGKISGVWASQNSGAPGSDGATIRIRGYGTLNNTDPLILIDGVEGRMSDVNPSDIASMTVLKDAASAAIYGSRAANGVVLIETKKGEGEKVSINYNGYFGVQQLGRRYDLITDSPTYMRLWNKAVTNEGGDPLFPQEVIDAFASGNDPYKCPSTNYFDEVFRNSFTTQHNLSATFGGAKSNSYVSMGYLKNNGIIKNTDSERYNLSINSEAKVADWLTLGGRGRVMRKVSNQAFVDYDNDYESGIERVFYMMSNGHPFSTPYLQDGKTYGGTQALYLSGPKAGLPIVDTRNPFPDLYNGKNEMITNFMKGNVYATIRLMEGLTLSGQYSGQYWHKNIDNYNQLATCYTDLDKSNPTKPLDYPSTLQISRTTTDEFYSTFFANLNYNKTFNDIHDLGVLLGYQQESMTRRYTKAQTTDPSKSELHEVVSGTKNPFADGNKFQWRMLSWFGRVNYALYGKYLAEINLRADGSSRFAKGHRWGVFPSFSAGWRLGEESFIKNLGIFDNLKIRASWGKLGNQNIGSESNADYFPYLTVITQDYENSYNFSNTLAPGAAITGLVDPGITWETTTSTDIGLDLGFLNNRLNIEADYFRRLTTDIIVQLPIPTVLGDMKAPFENVGEMKNAGFELSLNWQDQNKASGFSYSIGANLTYVNNEVTKFRGGKSPDQLFLIREGYSYKTLYGFTQEGIYQTDAEAADHMKNNSFTPKAGYIRYKDVNGDGKLDYQDKEEIGNTIPKFTYGLNASLSWKGFDLNMQFSGIAGVHGYFRNDWTIPLGVSGGTITKKWENAWTPENPNNEIPMITLDADWHRQESSFWSCNMSWFKMKNIQVGYEVPKAIAQKMFLQKLYVYLNATDVFTIVSSKYEGFDPERDSFERGDYHYPIPRVFSLGLNLSF